MSLFKHPILLPKEVDTYTRDVHKKHNQMLIQDCILYDHSPVSLLTLRRQQKLTSAGPQGPDMS
jgi:hypothetical protein